VDVVGVRLEETETVVDVGAGEVETNADREFRPLRNTMMATTPATIVITNAVISNVLRINPSV